MEVDWYGWDWDDMQKVAPSKQVRRLGISWDSPRFWGTLNSNPLHSFHWHQYNHIIRPTRSTLILITF